jgi:hypothetical protein
MSNPLRHKWQHQVDQQIYQLNPQNLAWEGRDRLVLSKAYASPALYAALGVECYVMAPANSVQPGTPPENLVAAYEAARDFTKSMV